MTIKEYKQEFLALFAKMQEEHGKGADVSIRHVREESEAYRIVRLTGTYPYDIPRFNENDICDIKFEDI